MKDKFKEGGLFNVDKCSLNSNIYKHQNVLNDLNDTNVINGSNI